VIGRRKHETLGFPSPAPPADRLNFASIAARRGGKARGKGEHGRTLIFVALALLSFQISFPSTVFKATRKGITLVGTNEDSDNRLGQVRFFPAEANKYGRVLFGFRFNNFYQGGMNDQGLVLEWVTGGYQKWQKDPAKKTSKRALSELILEQCATVDQALELCDEYNEFSFSFASIMLVDKSGEAATVGFEDGKLKVLRANGRDQALGLGGPVAELRLGEAPEISKDAVKSILLECLQRGQVATQYSIIYDPQNGAVFVYLFLKSKEELRFALREELPKGRHGYDLTESLRQILRKKLGEKERTEEDR
jgi:hypothetical protein